LAVFDGEFFASVHNDYATYIGGACTQKTQKKEEKHSIAARLVLRALSTIEHPHFSGRQFQAASKLSVLRDSVAAEQTNHEDDTLR
jgi:hypothetical protein